MGLQHVRFILTYMESNSFSIHAQTKAVEEEHFMMGNNMLYVEEVFPQCDCTSSRADLKACYKDVWRYHENGALGVGQNAYHFPSNINICKQYKSFGILVNIILFNQ